MALRRLRSVTGRVHQFWQYDVIPEGVKGIEFTLLRNKGRGFLTLDRETIWAWQRRAVRSVRIGRCRHFGQTPDRGRGSTTQYPKALHSVNGKHKFRGVEPRGMGSIPIARWVCAFNWGLVYRLYLRLWLWWDLFNSSTLSHFVSKPWRRFVY